MFNLFKKSEKKEAPIIGVAEEKPISVDAQIHIDVYSAQELLINEANNILNAPVPYDVKRYETLKKLSALGFNGAEQVAEFDRVERQRAKHEKTKSTIEDYRRRYPLNRFIDQDSVEKVCKKYGLVLAEAGDYIAEIPEKNQDEIVNFTFHLSDYREPREIGSRSMWLRFRPLIIGGICNTDETLRPTGKIMGKDLLIVAPVHKLNLEGKELNGHILRIKDPIVLQPVNGGYLIVTSWGLEAADEAVVNNILN